MSNAKGADKAAVEVQDLPFEDALKRLETIVESMEAQDLPLETLLARYEEGARLTALCQSKLSEAESAHWRSSMKMTTGCASEQSARTNFRNT